DRTILPKCRSFQGAGGAGQLREAGRAPDGVEQGVFLDRALPEAGGALGRLGVERRPEQLQGAGLVPPLPALGELALFGLAGVALRLGRGLGEDAGGVVERARRLAVPADGLLRVADRLAIPAQPHPGDAPAVVGVGAVAVEAERFLE